MSLKLNKFFIVLSNQISFHILSKTKQRKICILLLDHNFQLPLIILFIISYFNF
jgi:hypothetical protein